MTTKNKKTTPGHKNRINQAFLFIDENLNADLSLNNVSKIAFFSPYHFHRIFKFMTGETLNSYVTRRRLEKSALDLIHKNIGITEIAQQWGFNDNSSFSRAFKKFYGVSPTEFKKQNPNKFSKIRQVESKNGQAYPDYEQYICIINNLKNWIKMNANIEIKEMPKMDLAYVSCVGPQNMTAAYQKIMQWATPHGLMDDKTKMVTIYYDSFKVTESSKVRMSACILLNKAFTTEGEIGLTSIQPCKCIVGHFEVGLDEFEKSWTGMFVWMSENGYKKADENPFEVYHNNFNEHPEKKAIVDFCIPIE
jgi:AraC family transcriptional regulator